MHAPRVSSLPRPAALLAPLLAALCAPLANVPLACAASPAREAAEVSSGALAVPGFDTLEHRFGLSFGAGRVPALALGLAAWRADYTLAWRGWGLGVGVSLPLRAEGESNAGLELRRGLLLGPGLAWATVALGITRLEQGRQGARDVVLYHGTSSSLELAYELAPRATLRPFVALRADLPWYTTEIETLRPGPSADPAQQLTAIGYRRAWTPSYGVWVGFAL